MCADISALGNLAPAEPLDLDIYASAKGGQSIPVAGRYTVRAPESFPATAFSATKAGYLSVQIDPTVVGPTNEGYTVRFAKVSAKNFPRSLNGEQRQVSMIGDYLKACGETGQIPGDPQALADAVERTAGRTYDVILDWEARHAPTGFTVRGMKSFPSDGNGGFLPYVEHPTEKNADGQPLRLRANIVVRRFVDPAQS